MAAFRNKDNGSWYVQFRYTDWRGERKQKLKRGFATKKEALAWEREFLMQKQAGVGMTFESFVAVQFGKPQAVRVAVAGGMAIDDGVSIQCVPSAEMVPAVGIVAAPCAVLPQLVPVEVKAVVLRLHHRVVHLRAGDTQPRHGVGVFAFGVGKLRLPVDGGNGGRLHFGGADGSSMGSGSF